MRAGGSTAPVLQDRVLAPSPAARQVSHGGVWDSLILIWLPASLCAAGELPSRLRRADAAAASARAVPGRATSLRWLRRTTASRLRLRDASAGAPNPVVSGSGGPASATCHRSSQVVENPNGLAYSPTHVLEPVAAPLPSQLMPMHTASCVALSPLLLLLLLLLPPPLPPQPRQAPYGQAPAGFGQAPQQPHFGMHAAPMVVQGSVQGVPHTGNTRQVPAPPHPPPVARLRALVWPLRLSAGLA